MFGFSARFAIVPKLSRVLVQKSEGKRNLKSKKKEGKIMK
jgi:hypothetical protein